MTSPLAQHYLVPRHKQTGNEAPRSLVAQSAHLYQRYCGRIRVSAGNHSSNASSTVLCIRSTGYTDSVWVDYKVYPSPCLQVCREYPVSVDLRQPAPVSEQVPPSVGNRQRFTMEEALAGTEGGFMPTMLLAGHWYCCSGLSQISLGNSRSI